MKNIRLFILAWPVCCALATALAACNNENEVVPLNKTNSSTKVYKLPDPVLLTDEEQEAVQAVRDEYREATN